MAPSGGRRGLPRGSVGGLRRPRLRRPRLLLVAGWLLSLSATFLGYSLLLACCPGAPPAPPKGPAAPAPSAPWAPAEGECLPAAVPHKRLLQEKRRPCGPGEARAANASSSSSSPPPGLRAGPRLSPPGAGRRLPQALIVGVKKGGTRAVLEFIRGHPSVRALGTEPHFFDRHFQRGLEWYSCVCTCRHVGRRSIPCNPEAPEFTTDTRNLGSLSMEPRHPVPRGS